MLPPPLLLAMLETVCNIQHTLFRITSTYPQTDSHDCTTDSTLNHHKKSCSERASNCACHSLYLCTMVAVRVLDALVCDKTASQQSCQDLELGSYLLELKFVKIEVISFTGNVSCG